MSALRGRFEGASVLVTGHTGFKGSWLCEWLLAMGARVHGYALAPEREEDLFVSARLGERLASSTIADVRDMEGLSEAVRASTPSFVVHMAAQPLVRKSFREPLETFETNIMGTANLLSACAKQDTIGCVLVVTSDKCYRAPAPDGGHSERDPMGGHDPYSASKGAAEIVTDSYRKSFYTPAGLGLPSARAGNVIGGGDWSEDRLIPDIIRGVRAGEPVFIRRPMARRPWQHVLDALRGYLMLIDACMRDGEAWSRGVNFGPNASQSATVREVTEALMSELDAGEATYATEVTGPHETGTLTLDASLARESLGWAPALDTAEALSWTARWYAGWARGEDAAELMRAQIEEFEARVEDT